MEPDFGCLVGLIYGLIILCLVVAAAVLILLVVS